MRGGVFSQSTRRRVADRQDGACALCCVIVVETVGYAPVRPCEWHHRLPRRSGGRRGDMARVTSSPANSLLLCGSCHVRVESERVVAVSFGWVVPEGRNPSHVPVFHLGQWVLLDDSGNVYPTDAPLDGAA